ncbi:MAG: hypothetical protein ACTSX9_08670 [Candidatus Njordarchaeales archaeon]
MLTIKRLLPVIFLGLVLMAAPSQAFAQSKPRWNSDTATIEASGIIVQFHQRTPQYKFWIPGENDTAVYIVKFVKIIEFIDVDEDGEFDPMGDTILARAELTAHDQWNITAAVLPGPENSTELRVVMEGYVAVITHRAGMQEERVNVTFVNHIFDKDVSIEGYVVKGGAELKIDVIISDWPWHNNESKLALMILFAGHFRGEKEERAPEMHHVREEEHAMHRVEMRGDNVGAKGVFTFRENVRVRYHNGTEYEEKVNATDDFRHGSAAQYIVYPHFEGTLEHDPSILIEKEEAPTQGVLKIVTSPYLWAGAAIIAIIAGIILIRRK